MKNMKKSTKTFCLKLAASILSTILVASIALPMNVLATTVDTTEILSENTTINSSSPDYSDNIIREIEEERDEFSKTFLMADGTYYTYVSPVAIHEFVEDKWVNIDDSLSETPSTISEAESTVKEYVEDVETVSSQISTFALYEEPSAITVSSVGSATETEMGYSLPCDGALIIKPTTITKFSEANRVLLLASLTVNIGSDSSNDNVALYIKSLSSEANASTSYSVINNEDSVFAKNYLSSITQYDFDITGMYSKWERGNLNNYGVALVCPDADDFAPITVTSTPFLSLRYKDVDANDSSFTYHTLDLGRAGILSINDITNAFKLEQTIAGLECSMLPVTLTRTIASSNFSLDSYANVSSEWNYGYSLVILGTTATVTLPQGTKLEFQKPQDVISVDGYQVWEQPPGDNYVSGVTLHLKDSAANSGGVGTNYKDCYVNINGIEYWFNSLGRIKHIQKADKILNISYEFSNDADSFVINKLVDSDGNQYCITYSLYSVNNTYYIYASKIELKDYNNNPISFDNVPIEINISNSVSGSNIISTYSYPDGTNEPSTISYYYDLTGKLLGIVSADGTVTELHYKSSDNNYLTGYTQTKNNEIINTFTISSDNTYERVFEGTLIQKETQRYDYDFQLVTYHYGENTVSMNYNDGIISSYAVNNYGFAGDNDTFNEDDNEVDDGDFSNALLSTAWKTFSGPTPELNTENEFLIIENSGTNSTSGIKQNLNNLSADTTYVFSVETSVIDSVPSTDHGLFAKIELYTMTNVPIETIEMPFDVSLLNQDQIRMCTFKTEEAYKARVSVYAKNNAGTFYVDNVRLYKAKTDDGSVAIPTVSTSDPIVETTENGTVIRETIANGNLQMYQEYEYSLDGTKLLTSTDFNGVSTYFDYSGRTGKLNKKGYELVDD